MVCKEEVLLWFKDLDSYKRIDLLYELLNMCLPFELRFIGTCIEELGKHTYQELRGPTITANDVEKLSKDVSLNQGILDESVRHRVLVYLSLLSSRNYSVANWLYKKLLRTDVEEYLVKEKGKDEVLLSEFLLLYTMTLHHPAFTFEQKQYFSRTLESLIDFRENRVSAKHCALGYPPGFGYPTQKIHDPTTISVKTAPASCGETPSTYQQQLPGLPHLPLPHIDFIPQMWTRPGFPYGAPEPHFQVPPFPAPTISPLVSQTASPNQSRSASPHRTHLGVRPTPTVLPPPGAPPVAPPLNGPPPPIDVMNPPLPAQLPLDQLSQPSLPLYNNLDLKLGEEDTGKFSSIVEEKHLLWPQQGPINPDVKPNGIRFPHFVGKKPFLLDQMQALNLDGENSLHHSNSSSNSSLNQTPPGTPSNTPASTPHGPGRGETKPRPNGMPQFGASPGPPIHDTTSPPPPPPAFSSSSVPYSYPQQFAAMPPNRSMFPFNQGYNRPTFTQYLNYPSDTSFPTYTYPYIPLVYSSPYPPRTPPGCYNCGAPSHIGSDCTGQNIEEITQKKTYQLEYASPLPDMEK